MPKRSLKITKRRAGKKLSGKNDSKLPQSNVISKRVGLSEIRFKGLQQIRLYVPSKIYPIAPTSSTINISQAIMDPGDGTIGYINFASAFGSVFVEYVVLHARITVIPTMATGTNQQAYVLMGIDPGATGPYGSLNNASCSSNQIVPLSSSDESVQQFTVFERNIGQMNFRKIGSTPNPTTIQVYGNSTTGLPTSGNVMSIRVEWFIAFRNLNGQ